MMRVILNGIILGTNIADGSFNTHILILSAIPIGVSALSLFLAELFLNKINAEAFTKITYVLLLISGAAAVLSA